MSHVTNFRTFGARRVWHDMLAEGNCCGRHRERAASAHTRSRWRGLPKEQDERSVIAGNVLDNRFTADEPDQKWVADFSYIWTTGRMALCRWRDRPVLAVDGGLDDKGQDDRPSRLPML